MEVYFVSGNKKFYYKKVNFLQFYSILIFIGLTPCSCFSTLMCFSFKIVEKRKD